MPNIQMLSQPSLMNCVQKDSKMECPAVKDQKAPAAPAEPAQDSVEIKSGLKPSLKGGALGLVAGSSLTVMVMAKAYRLGSSSLAMLALPAAALPAAAVAGAVTANITDNKLKGILLGAGVGAGTGAAIALVSRDPRVIVVGAGVGAVAGAVGGLSGSIMAQRK